MVHHGQRLPLGLEAGDDLPAVHAGLDDLERDAAADRLVLLGHVDDAHAPFADLLEELVRPDAVAGPLAGRLVRPGEAVGAALEDAGGPVVGLEQPLDAPAQGVIARRTPRPEMRAARPRGPCRGAAAKIDSSLIAPDLHRARPMKNP